MIVALYQGIDPQNQREYPMSADKIKELASDQVLMSAYLILAECEKLKARLSLELQAVRDDRRRQYKEFHEFMVEQRETLTKIQAQFKVEAQLLNLIRPDAGEDKCQASESPSSQSRMLKSYAKNTR
jgi:hypothetical protein